MKFFRFFPTYKMSFVDKKHHLMVLRKRVNFFRCENYKNIYFLGFSTMEDENMLDILHDDRFMSIFKIVNKIDYVYDELGLDIDKELKGIYIFDAKYENMYQLIILGSGDRLIEKKYPRDLWMKLYIVNNAALCS